SSARISRAFRSSFRKNAPSFSKMPVPSQPAHRKLLTSFSPVASASTRSASPCRSWAAAGSPVGSVTSPWERCRSSRTAPQVGRDFDPEVGFLNRRGGYRFFETTVMWKKRYLNSKLSKDWHPHVGYRGYYGLDGYRQEDRIHIDITEWYLASGATVGPEVNIEHQGLQRPFAIASNVTLPVGSYDYTSMGFDFGTNASAPLSLNLRADVGGFYNGTRRGGS